MIVQRSAQMPHPLQWEFPGGKLTAGESASDAIVREMQEELGVLVAPIRELDEVHWEYPNKKIALVPVICEIRSGELCLKEHVNVKWLGLNEMKKMNVLEADRLIIQQLEGDK